MNSWKCELTPAGYVYAMSVRVSWADELSAATGGPNEFWRPRRQREREGGRDPHDDSWPGNVGKEKAKRNHAQPQGVDGCVATVIARYLGHEALTMLKQQAVLAGVGLGFLASRLFLGHAIGGTIAVGTLTEIGVNIGIRMDHLMRAGAFIAGAMWGVAKYYPKLVKESFNNKKEAVGDLRSCFD